VAESTAKLEIAVDWRETGSDGGAKGPNQSQDAVLEKHCASVFVRSFKCRRMAWDVEPEFEKFIFWYLFLKGWHSIHMLSSL
jgi:hypothetical protein